MAVYQEDDVPKSKSLKEDDLEKSLQKNDTKVNRWYHIDLDMLPSKLLFSFDSAKRQGTVPFMVAFFNSLGLSKSEAGVIVGFRVLGSVIGSPIWGVIADKKKAHRFLFIILTIASSLFACSQLLISLPYADQTLNTCPNFKPSKQIQNQTYNSTQQKFSTSQFPEENRRRLFFLLFAASILVTFFEGGVLPFIEFGVLRRIESIQDRDIQYGKQRASSPIGAAIGIIISNLLIEYFPTANITCFAVIYILYTMWSLLELGISLMLFRGPIYNKTTQQQPRARKLSMQQTLRKTCTRIDVIVLLMSSFFIGNLYAVYRTYTFVFLRELNATSSLITATMALPFVMTIFSIYFSELIIKAFKGEWNIIAFSFLAYSVRFLTMSFLQNPWYALLIEMLHPFCSGLFLIAGIRKIKEISPPKILTVMYTIYYIVLQSISNIAGSSIGGVIYDEFGGRMLYRGAACVSGICFLCLLAFALWYDAKSLMKEKDRRREGLLRHKRNEDDEILQTKV